MSAILKLGLTGGLSTLFLNNKEKKTTVQCCGIVGYVGNQNVEPILIDGIKILQNRGYDSCGISTLNSKNQIITTKYASKGTTSDSIELLANETSKFHSNHNIGIAHTRWATHGAKTDINAHPHSDYKQRISLVHNGTIENYSELREDLLNKNIPFISETDTEVISNYIGWYLDNGKNLETAISETVSLLRGTWGLAIIHKDFPDQIVLARNGSPLLVGCSESEVFVASEAAALANHTNQFLALHDGEICVLNPKGIQHLIATRQQQKIMVEDVTSTPDPFPHWTLKEIFEQPESLARALNHGARISSIDNKAKLGGLDLLASVLIEIKNMQIIGCGTSLYAGMYGEKIMQYLHSFDFINTIDASELEADSLCLEKSGVLLLSQSGETLDTIRACQLAEMHDVRRLSVVNVVGSLLARSTNCGVYLNAGREVAVASTKAFTSQVAVLSLIATWFAQHKNVSPDRCAAIVDAIQRLPVYASMCLDCRKQCKELAQIMKNATTIFVLGKSTGYPVALEAALKIKEIAYIHAEGFPAGALKHGPFALIDSEKRTPVILIAPSDHTSPMMRNAATQLKARGAYLLSIVDDINILKNIVDYQIVVPNNGFLTALLCAIPLQLFAYELAIARGINPDKPRGLAKTVTVG